MSDRYTLNQQLAIIMIASVLVVGFLGVINIGVVEDFPAAPILGAAISLLTAQQVMKHRNGNGSGTSNRSSNGTSEHNDE